MAAFSRLRGPLAASLRSPTLQTCSRTRLTSPFPSAPLPRTSSPARVGRRPLATSTALLEKKYTTDHEWIELSEDGKTGTIGISIYAAKSLGDVVFVELPEVDLEVAAGDSMGAVESVKSASDILTPVSGTIVEANDVLQEKPGTINKGPESDGWIAKIRVKDSGEMDKLMGMDEYAKFTAE